MGICDKCNLITMTDIIQTKNLPGSIEDLEKYAKEFKPKKVKKC